MKKSLKYIHALELDPKSRRQLEQIKAINWEKQVSSILKRTKDDSFVDLVFRDNGIQNELFSIYDALDFDSPIVYSWAKPIVEFNGFSQFLTTQVDQFFVDFDVVLFTLIKEFIGALKKSYKAVIAFLRNKKKYSFSINKRSAFRKIFQLLFKNLDDEDHSDDFILANVINQNLIINIKKRPNDRKRIYRSNQYLTRFGD